MGTNTKKHFGGKEAWICSWHEWYWGVVSQENISVCAEVLRASVTLSAADLCVHVYVCARTRKIPDHSVRYRVHEYSLYCVLNPPVWNGYKNLVVDQVNGNQGTWNSKCRLWRPCCRHRRCWRDLCHTLVWAAWSVLMVLWQPRCHFTRQNPANV